MKASLPFVQQFPAVLVVSQSDRQIAPILRQSLHNDGIKVFTIADLGESGAGATWSLHENVTNVLKSWYSPAYIRRSAVSWGLCSAAFASGYVGESASGFS